MFSVNDYVFYGLRGVCRVTDICPCPFDKKDPRQYYILKPVGVQSGAIFYAPVDNVTLPLRALLTKEESMALLARIPQISELNGMPDKQRRDMCRNALADNDPDSYVRVIKTLSRRREKLEQSGHQLSAREADLERMARLHLLTELSVSLEQPAEWVETRLEEALLA